MRNGYIDRLISTMKGCYTDLQRNEIENIVAQAIVDGANDSEVLEEAETSLLI